MDSSRKITTAVHGKGLQQVPWSLGLFVGFAMLVASAAYAVDGFLVAVHYELPAGKLDPGESRLACVKRELREETGYQARRIRHLLDFWPTPAFSNELLRLYVAHGLVPGRQAPDHDEFIEAVALPFAEALDLVRQGRIRDSKTVIALLAARCRL